MFHASFRISNPFKENYFENVWNKYGRLKKHKAWELELTRSGNLLALGLSVTARTDHAGVRFNVSLLSWDFEAQVYDTRHWDEEKGEWHTYN